MGLQKNWLCPGKKKAVNSQIYCAKEGTRQKREGNETSVYP